MCPVCSRARGVVFALCVSKTNLLVQLFYPFDYTFVCPTELISYSNAKDKFDELNTKALAISTDSHHAHLAWTRAKYV